MRALQAIGAMRVFSASLLMLLLVGCSLFAGSSPDGRHEAGRVWDCAYGEVFPMYAYDLVDTSAALDPDALSLNRSAISLLHNIGAGRDEEEGFVYTLPGDALLEDCAAVYGTRGDSGRCLAAVCAYQRTIHRGILAACDDLPVVSGMRFPDLHGTGDSVPFSIDARRSCALNVRLNTELLAHDCATIPGQELESYCVVQQAIIANRSVSDILFARDDGTGDWWYGYYPTRLVLRVGTRETVYLGARVNATELYGDPSRPITNLTCEDNDGTAYVVPFTTARNQTGRRTMWNLALDDTTGTLPIGRYVCSVVQAPDLGAAWTFDLTVNPSS